MHSLPTLIQLHSLISTLIMVSLCLVLHIVFTSPSFPDDPTNLHRHARYNAQEAISLAKQRAQQFDTQAALERKTNEALKLAKAQAHIYENAAQDEAPAAPPLVDCMYCFALIHICSHHCSGFRRTKLPEPYIFEWSFDSHATQDVDSSIERIPAQRFKLACYTL